MTPFSCCHSLRSMRNLTTETVTAWSVSLGQSPLATVCHRRYLLAKRRLSCSTCGTKHFQPRRPPIYGMKLARPWMTLGASMDIAGGCWHLTVLTKCASETDW